MSSLLNNDSNIIKSTQKSFLLIGGLLFLLGGVGIFLPYAVSITIEILLGWLMLTGGLLWAWNTYSWHKSTFNSWLKPLILLAGGILLLVFPVSGIAAITLMISFYLVTDAFGSFALALDRRPLPGWVWMILNAIISFALALLLLWGWPMTSPVYLGIIVSISLLFDGLTLFMLGLAMKVE